MKQIRHYFAGVNTRPLAEATRGQDVLVSFADFKKSPGLWGWLRPMIERGHFRSVILDSGAFTELSQRKRGKVFTVGVEEYGAFAAENAHLFTWIANLDDIEGDVDRSNRNLAYLEALGLPVVPVYHESESVEQLAHCIDRARAGRGVLAVGCQRPKGKLVPRNVVQFLTWLFAELAGAEVDDIQIHGFGLTRYATAACPCGADGFAFDSVDSTTWIAEACALERSGAMPQDDRLEARRAAFRATVDSYEGNEWVIPAFGRFDVHQEAFDHQVADEAGSQARTVARRSLRAAARGERDEPTPERVSVRADQRLHGRGGERLATPGRGPSGEGGERDGVRDHRPDAPGLPRPGG